MNNEFGTGDTRKSNLGDRYDEIQNIIEHIAEADTDTLVADVWADKYGGDDVRRTILGSRYQEVQDAIDGANQAVYHFVNPGDNISYLAQWYGTTVGDILSLNPQIDNPNRIYPGDKIRIK